MSHQFRVRFDANEYSVPWRLSGRMITLRANIDTVQLYLGHKRVCCHAREWEKNKSIINLRHEDGLIQRKPGAQVSADIAAVKAVGPHATQYLDFLGAQNKSIRSELKHLMILITVYGAQALEACIKDALGKGMIGSHHLERLLIRTHHPRPTKPPPLRLHDEKLIIPPTIPNLKSYDALLFE